MGGTTPIVAGMATMPTRGETAPRAIASILPQVDRLWLFLDRFDSVPDYARHEKIRVLHSQDLGDLRANGKLMGVIREEADCYYFTVDDDIAYPADFTHRMCTRLAKYDNRAIVGLHGSVLRPPIKSYRHNRRVYGRKAGLFWDHIVDVLGTDAVAFHTGAFRIDVREWNIVNMVDLQFAFHARQAGLPLISIRRSRHWVKELGFKQPDSIYLALTKDESRQTQYARKLVEVSRPAAPAFGLRIRSA